MMRLSDIMSSMHLEAYAEIALLLFLSAFVIVVLELLVRADEDRWTSVRLLPLESDDGRDGDSDHDRT